MAERLSTVVPAVSKMLDELANARSQCGLHWETALVETAVAIADKLVRGQLQQRPEAAVNVISDTVRLAMGSTSLQIQLNPVDLESLGEGVRTLVRDSIPNATVELNADASISAGGCVVTTENGQIDAQLETMLERIASELLDGLE